MKIPINLNEVSEFAPDPIWQHGCDDARSGIWRRNEGRTPQEQRHYDDGYDEGLILLDAEREAEREEENR